MTGPRDPDYVSFFFDSPSSVPPLDTLEISHPAFSRVYRLVRNAPFGLDAKLEDGTDVHFEYCPLRIRDSGERSTLDYGLSVDLGDLGEIIPDELERARAADQMRIRPTVKYRVYRGDKLDKPMLGPIRLEAPQISRTREGASFDAVAPSLNLNRTGEFYTVDRFPMLLAFL